MSIGRDCLVHRRFTALITREERWFVAHCVELGVVSQVHDAETTSPQDSSDLVAAQLFRLRFVVLPRRVWFVIDRPRQAG